MASGYTVSHTAKVSEQANIKSIAANTTATTFYSHPKNFHIRNSHTQHADNGYFKEQSLDPKISMSIPDNDL